MNTIEQNKLIAEFMGARKKKNAYFYDGILFPTGWNTCRPENMKYHSSWDWLMPVVEKIEGMDDFEGDFDCHFEILRDGCLILAWHGETLFENYEKTKIQATYNTVVQFIEWHNSQNQPT
jgi:hypothetical protein